MELEAGVRAGDDQFGLAPCGAGATLTSNSKIRPLIMDALDHCSYAGGLGGSTLAEAASAAVDLIVNRTFDELVIGDFAQIVRTLTQDDIELFANVSGDVNPAHLDPVYADETRFHGVIAHGMLGGSLFSTVLGTMLPGAAYPFRLRHQHRARAGGQG